jgi:hypothetical protein
MREAAWMPGEHHFPSRSGEALVLNIVPICRNVTVLTHACASVTL